MTHFKFIIIFISALFFGSFSHMARAAGTGADIPQMEDDWAKAQQNYYDELKKMKSPRDPSKVNELKERILTPAKKALESAYGRERAEKSKLKPVEGESTATTESKTPPPVEQPAVPVKDGTGATGEIRYSKKGAPADMTPEESPENLGPTLVPADSSGTGEISFQKKKPSPKPSQKPSRLKK